MSEPFIGEIRVFAGNFAPVGYAFCNGQLLSIAQNTALFSILGTTYGGNGTTNFALPDLQGRAALGQGQGPGLQPYVIGEIGGEETVTLTVAEMPVHSHALEGAASQSTAAPGPSVVLGTTSGLVPAYGGANAITPLAPGAISPPPGSGQPHENMQPYLVLNYIIALVGIFPSRN
jgi:microcystin-dependent protein